jgi:hypothetical protein
MDASSSSLGNMTYVEIVTAFDLINGCYMNIGQDKHYGKVTADALCSDTTHLL